MAFGFWLSSGCNPSAVPVPAIGRPAIPRIRATTLIIKTNLLPEKKAFLHLVMIANGKARIGNELDEWRLFDLDTNTVTFVDDVARTYRTESFGSLSRQKQALLSRPLPDFVPVAEFTETDSRRTFDTFEAKLYLIRMGGYQRSLWMSTALDVPDRLFPLIVVSDPLSTPYSPAMRNVFEELVQLRGFPVIDRSDVTYGGQSHVVEKKLLKVEHRRIPADWLQIPAGYRDLTPRPSTPPSRRRGLPVPLNLDS